MPSPLLHIPRAGATNSDFGRPCWVYRARCPAKRACSARARWCAPARRLAVDRTSLSKAFVLATGHSTWFHSPALHSPSHYPPSFASAPTLESYFAIQGLCVLRDLLHADLSAPGTPKAVDCKTPVGPKCRPALRPNTLPDSPVGQGRWERPRPPLTHTPP